MSTVPITPTNLRRLEKLQREMRKAAKKPKSKAYEIAWLAYQSELNARASELFTAARFYHQAADEAFQRSRSL